MSLVAEPAAASSAPPVSVRDLVMAYGSQVVMQGITFAVRRGDGCLGRWLEVGATAWVCDDAVELSAAGSISPLVRTWRDMPDGLPYRYYFVGPDGTFGYRRVEAADIIAVQKVLGELI